MTSALDSQCIIYKSLFTLSDGISIKSARKFAPPTFSKSATLPSSSAVSNSCQYTSITFCRSFSLTSSAPIPSTLGSNNFGSSATLGGGFLVGSSSLRSFAGFNVGFSSCDSLYSGSSSVQVLLCLAISSCLSSVISFIGVGFGSGSGVSPSAVISSGSSTGSSFFLNVTLQCSSY